jgi:hypothetical protein
MHAYKLIFSICYVLDSQGRQPSLLRDKAQTLKYYVPTITFPLVIHLTQRN